MATDSTRYREDYEKNGLSPTHQQAIAWVPRGARVLELGCSSGYISRILQEEKGCTVVGVEIDPAAAREAREAGVEVREGSLEDPAFRASIEGPFDIVLATDVLEHLAAPGPVLEHFKQWLGPHGQAIVAVPNVATWPIRAQLFFRGDFEYQETGILDRTHLHFFTWDTIHALVREQGWEILETKIDGWAVPGAHRLLFEWPLEVRARLADYDDKGPARRKLEKFVFDTAGKTLGIGERISRPLIRKWPNLCAPHVAFLLSAPSSR